MNDNTCGHVCCSPDLEDGCTVAECVDHPHTVYCCPVMEQFRNPVSGCVPRLTSDGYLTGCDESFRQLPDDPDSDEAPNDDPAKVVVYCPWCGTHLKTGSVH